MIDRTAKFLSVAFLRVTKPIARYSTPNMGITIGNARLKAQTNKNEKNNQKLIF